MGFYRYGNYRDHCYWKFSFQSEKIEYRHHISPIAETYAYCLMPNHFHLVVRMRRKEVILELMRANGNFSKVLNFGKVGQNAASAAEAEADAIEKFLSKQFGNLFSSYTQAFNKVNNRRGSMFIKNFKRKPITDKEHFLNKVIYTHRNPIHHGFCTQFDQWEFSSYNEIVDGCCDWLETEKLLKMTDGLENFIGMHQQNLADFVFEGEI